MASEHVLPINENIVRKSQEQFNQPKKNGVAVQSLRNQLTWLGARFLADQSASNWHHLVMVAGNFKRQGGTVIYLPLTDSKDLQASQDRRRVRVPVLAAEIDRDDQSKWWRQRRSRADNLLRSAVAQRGDPSGRSV